MKKFVAHTAYCNKKTQNKNDPAFNSNQKTKFLSNILEIVPKLGIDKLFSSSQTNANNTYPSPINQTLQKYNCQNTAKALQFNREKTNSIKNEQQNNKTSA